MSGSLTNVNGRGLPAFVFQRRCELVGQREWVGVSLVSLCLFAPKANGVIMIILSLPSFAPTVCFVHSTHQPSHPAR